MVSVVKRVVASREPNPRATPYTKVKSPSQQDSVSHDLVPAFQAEAQSQENNRFAHRHHRQAPAAAL